MERPWGSRGVTSDIRFRGVEDRSRTRFTHHTGTEVRVGTDSETLTLVRQEGDGRGVDGSDPRETLPVTDRPDVHTSCRGPERCPTDKAEAHVDTTPLRGQTPCVPPTDGGVGEDPEVV